VPLSPDEAAKLIMSAGLIQPEGQAKLAALAQKGKEKVALEDASEQNSKVA
jgi:uncharacterized membrane protein